LNTPDPGVENRIPVDRFPTKISTGILKKMHLISIN
jgi:hypothetical protein